MSIARPILFSAPMVRAILREIEQPGTGKTQTRRVLKLPTKTFSGAPIYERPDMGGWEPTISGGGGCFIIDNAGERIPEPEKVAIWHRTTGVCMEAPIQAGDRLYVREAWHAARSLNSAPPRDIPHDADIEHAATARSYAEIGLKGKLRPGIFLPRWASRLTLIVTDVRVQRLLEISEADAIAEGCFKGKATGRVFANATSMRLGGDEWRNARDWYADLWDQLNAKRGFGWDANPWVAAYTFRPILGNIDQVAS